MRCLVINPIKQPGRVTLITRYGAGKECIIPRSPWSFSDAARFQIESHLAGHIRAVQVSGHPVAWVCDPMHGKCVVSRRPFSALSAASWD